MRAHQIETARLALVAATAETVAADLEGKAALASALGAEIPDRWPPDLYDAPAMRGSLERLRQDDREVGWQLWYLLLKGKDGAMPKAVGVAGFKGRPLEGGSVEIGYSVLSGYQRRGYASEAVAALVGWAFSHQEVARVLAETLPHLAPSIRVLEKNGFSHSGQGSEEGAIRFQLPRSWWSRWSESEVSRRHPFGYALEAVIFDMDGLMLNTEPLYKRAWTEVAEGLGYPLGDRLYSRFLGRTGPDSEAILLREFGPAFPMEEFRLQRRRLWDELVQQQGIEVKAGLLELLDELEERGVARAVATSSNRRQTEVSLLATGLSGRFDAVVTADDVARGKPAPDLFLEAARRLGVPGSSCLVLEDATAGVKAAVAAGMVSILVPDSAQPVSREGRRAYRVVPDLVQARPLVMQLLGTIRASAPPLRQGGRDEAPS